MHWPRRSRESASVPDLPRTQRVWERASFWLPALIVIGGMAATCSVAFALWKLDDGRDQQRFLQAADIELRTIEYQFSTYTALLQGAAGLFAAENDAVSLVEFRAYVQRIDFEHRYPGFLGVGFTRYLPAANQAALVVEMRRQVIADFQVHPATGDTNVSPIVFAEPPNPRNQAAVGYDVVSDPMRRQMVDRARDTGAPATSARLQLVQEIDESKQAGFLVAMPVYAGGTVPLTVEERRRTFFGFVFGAFRADDLFRSIVTPGAQSQPQNVSYLAHWHSLGRHLAPCSRQKTRLPVVEDCQPCRPRGRHPSGDRDHRNR